MSTEFINISANVLAELISLNLSDYDRRVYLVISSLATFKYQVYGVYKKQTYTTLLNAINNATGESRNITQLKRALTKLHNRKLTVTLHDKGELIISLDPTATLQKVISAIENDQKAFNIYQPRISELASNLKIVIEPVKTSMGELSEPDDTEVPLFPGDLLKGHLSVFQDQVMPEASRIS